MSCEHIQALLALYAGDDLGDEERMDVQTHLRTCETCAAADAEYRASISLAREATEPRFDEAFYASIRGTVLAEIAPRQARRWPHRVALALAASLLVAAGMLLLVAWLRAPGAADQDLRAEQKDTPQPATPDRVNPTPEPGPEPPSPKPRRVHRVVPPRRTVASEVATAKPDAEPEMLRIEYQTADPNVRVIWFAPKQTESPAGQDKTGA